MKRAEIVVTMWPEPGKELYDRLFMAVAEAAYDVDAEGYDVDVSASIITPTFTPTFTPQGGDTDE